MPSKLLLIPRTERRAFCWGEAPEGNAVIAVIADIAENGLRGARLACESDRSGPVSERDSRNKRRLSVLQGNWCSFAKTYGCLTMNGSTFSFVVRTASCS